MINGLRVLAVVPARSGSKGVPDKNMRLLAGKSLIGHAGDCLGALDWVDRRVISTDSAAYAAEGKRFGLDAPFLRPSKLSDDRAKAIDAMQHALNACEKHWNERYDIFMLIEPTSPFRTPADIENAVHGMVDGDYLSAVTVSPTDTKAHPLKMLKVEEDRLEFYDDAAASITARQQLPPLYVRNGACYAMRREALLEGDNVITERTFASVIDRQLVNIDEPIDFEWAEFLLSRDN